MVTEDFWCGISSYRKNCHIQEGRLVHIQTCHARECYLTLTRTAASLPGSALPRGRNEMHDLILLSLCICTNIIQADHSLISEEPSCSWKLTHFL